MHKFRGLVSYTPTSTNVPSQFSYYAGLAAWNSLPHELGAMEPFSISKNKMRLLNLAFSILD